MRAIAAIAAMTMVGCFGSEQPCSARPTDPMCATADGGGGDVGTRDSGRDAGPMGDAHVACNGACTGATPHCLVSGSTETCVGCLAETDCTGGTHCETTSHACVACLTSAQCSTAAAARCDTTNHMCATCMASADCTHLTATPVCGAAGACVQCNSNTDCDATHGCDVATNTCVTFTAMSASPCGACVRDAQCQTGQLCVPMTFHSASVGSYCAWRRDATGSGAPNGDCANVHQYANTSTATSVDGTSTMVCELRVSTCLAHRDFLTGGSTAQCTGMTTGTMDDPGCGVPSATDGFCRSDGGGHQYCTVECTTTTDCPCTGGTCAAQYMCSGGFCLLHT